MGIHFSFDCCFTISAEQSSSAKTIYPAAPQTLTIWPSIEKNSADPSLMGPLCHMLMVKPIIETRKLKTSQIFLFLPNSPTRQICITSFFSLNRLYL